MNTSDSEMSRLNSMVHEIEDYAILVLDPYGNIESWNKGAEKIKGYTSREIIGKNFEIFYIEEDKAKRLPKALLSDAAMNGHVQHIGWRVRKDGSRFWGSVSITALHNDNNEVTGFIKVTRDLSDPGRLEETRRKYIDDLEIHSREMEQLTYIASHDLQEPLRTIKSFMYLLSEKCEPHLDEEGKMFMDTILQSVGRMQTLVKAVLEYSLLGTNKTIAEVDCNQLIEEIKNDLSTMITAKEAHIHYTSLPVIYGYAVELRQLFQNLINNAIKFSKPDVPPRIRIAAERSNQHWLFSITDNGLGIDNRYLYKIFQLFQRLHSRQDYQGTGIGLSYAKKIVELHGGKIWVESEPGKGSCFYFLLSDIKPD